MLFSKAAHAGKMSAETRELKARGDAMARSQSGIGFARDRTILRANANVLNAGGAAAAAAVAVESWEEFR